MQITRYLSLTEPQFGGCITAFIDSLTGELNAAAMYLRKLSGQPKGAAFAFEMSLDAHRYGALIVLDRWATLVDAFGPHLESAKYAAIVDGAPGRVQTAANLLGRTNALIDGSNQYSGDVVNACALAFQSVQAVFDQERKSAEESARLGPMLPDDFKQARRIFLEDLAAR